MRCFSVRGCFLGSQTDSFENKMMSRNGNEQASSFYQSNERWKTGLELLQATYSVRYIGCWCQLCCHSTTFYVNQKEMLACSTKRGGITGFFNFYFMGQRLKSLGTTDGE